VGRGGEALKLIPIRDFLGDKYSYDEIKLVRLLLRLAKPDYQRMLAFLKALRREHPAIAAEILTQTQELDLSDLQAFDQLHTTFAAAHANYPGELQAFFQQHPELIPPDEGK